MAPWNQVDVRMEYRLTSVLPNVYTDTGADPVRDEGLGGNDVSGRPLAGMARL